MASRTDKGDDLTSNVCIQVTSISFGIALLIFWHIIPGGPNFAAYLSAQKSAFFRISTGISPAKRGGEVQMNSVDIIRIGYINFGP